MTMAREESMKAGSAPEAERPPGPEPLTIVYEDRHLLVVIKPAGLVMHPAYRHPDGTLWNMLADLFAARGSLNDRAFCIAWTGRRPVWYVCPSACRHIAAWSACCDRVASRSATSRWSRARHLCKGRSWSRWGAIRSTVAVRACGQTASEP